jgi:Carboxypeptidase regulatory-like domain
MVSLPSLLGPAPGRKAAALIPAGLLLAALGGCGGGDPPPPPPPPPPSYAISGTVTDPFTVSPVAQVGITLVAADGGAGTAVGNATTDSSGRYSFSKIDTGSYTIQPNLANAIFTPALLSATLSDADVSAENFQVIQVSQIATGLTFLPSSFLSNQTFRVSLAVQNGALIFTDSTDQPLKKLTVSSSALTPIGARFSGAQGVALHGANVYWLSGNQLGKSSLTGTTSVLAQGQRDPQSNITTTIIADDSSVYWALTDTSSPCDPSCNDLIQRVPLDGSAPVTLAAGDRRIVALAEDADHIYWEEAMMEPYTAGCSCGSSVKSIPKAGGTVVVLVDGSLNGTLPNPGPGYIPGSWLPSGGIAVTASQVVFGFSAGPDKLLSVGLQGGAITTLTSLGTIRSIGADGTSAYWIDTANATLNRAPLAGGTVATLATGLFSAVSLRVTAGSLLFSDGGPPSGCCLQTGMGSVKSVPLGGGAITTVLAGLDAPVALDADAVHLVWTELSRVGAAPVAGGATTTLASGIANSLARITTDQNNIYLLDGELIKVVPLAGGTIERLAAALPVIASTGGLGPVNPNGDIVTDGTNVYWTADGGGPTVQRVPVGGGAPVTVATEALDTSTQPCYWRIAVDTENVYWTSNQTSSAVGCSVRKVPLAGGTAATVVDFPKLRDFTVDGGDVYFSELQTNTVQKVSTTGGSATAVVTGVSAWVLTHNAQRLFWLGDGQAGVAFAPEAGGMPVQMGGAASQPSVITDALAVDAHAAYSVGGQAGVIDSSF